MRIEVYHRGYAVAEEKFYSIAHVKTIGEKRLLLGNS